MKELMDDCGVEIVLEEYCRLMEMADRVLSERHPMMKHLQVEFLALKEYRSLQQRARMEMGNVIRASK